MRETINSINIAILLSANALCWVIPISKILAIIMAFCVAVHWITNKQFACRNTVWLYMYCILFFLFPLLSSFNISVENITQKYFLDYIVIGYAALLVSQSEFSIRKTLIALSIISIILIPTIVGMDLENMDVGVWMSVSYGVIRFIIALLLCILLYNYKYNIITKLILALPVVFYSVLYAAYASRGALLAVGIFIVFFLIVKGGKRSFSIAAFLTLLGIIIFANFIPIVTALVNGLQSIGVEIYALNKILFRADAGDITSGRADIYSNGVEMILESPIWGHGVGAYEVRYGDGETYVHNIILQQLIEGGLLLFIPLTLIVLLSFKQIFSKTLPQEIRLFLVFLMATGLIELLFSNYFWRAQGYWFLLGYTLSIYNKQQPRNRQMTPMTQEK